MRRQRLTAAAALAAAFSAAPASAQTLAQVTEPAPALRGFSDPGIGVTASPALGQPVSGPPSPASANAAIVRRARAARRTRPPTSDPIRLVIRPTLVGPGVAPSVQPPLTGLPDPDEPARPVLRRSLPDQPIAPSSAALGAGPGGTGLTGPVVPRPADDPYAPLGLRVGSVTLYPGLGQSVGYDTNPNRIEAGRRDSVVSQTELDLGIQSDWSRHELTGFLRGAYNEYPGDPAASRPEAAGRVGLRLDVTRDSFATIDGRFQVDTQRPFSPDLGVGVLSRPLIVTGGGSFGFTQRFNRLIGSIQANVDTAHYQDADLGGGLRLSQRDRDFNQYGVRARLGYEVHPGLIPFVEVLADTRDYALRTDVSGFRRSSDGIGGRAGASFELTRLVTAEIAAGAIRRSYEDPRLSDLTSPLLDAAVTWAVTPLTTVRATAQASVDETTVVGANGVRTFRGTLEVSHALRRNLTVTAGLSASDAEYNGSAISETGFGAVLRADYKFNRWLGLRASYNYEQLRSNFPGSSYSANVFLLGMRFTP